MTPVKEPLPERAYSHATRAGSRRLERTAMKSRLLLESLFGWAAIACAATVFIASALDPPDQTATGKPVPVSSASRSR